MNKRLKQTFLTLGLFAATALSAFGQTTQQPQPKPDKNNLLSRTELMILLKCWHTDRLTKFNEWPIGGFVSVGVGDPRKNLSITQGVYYNSNYTITPTGGVLKEFKAGKASFGLLAGVAIYPKVEKDRTTMTRHYGIAPENEKKRGCRTINMQLNDGSYLELRKEYRGRGIKGKFQIVPALLGTLSYDAYRGAGPFATFTYVPWRSGESKGLGIVAGGLRFNPSFSPN